MTGEQARILVAIRGIESAMKLLKHWYSTDYDRGMIGDGYPFEQSLDDVIVRVEDWRRRMEINYGAKK